VRVGTRGYRGAQLRCAVAENELALRSAQKNHGTRHHELLGYRFNCVLKCDRIDWLERCCGRPHTADGAHHNNHNAQYSHCHYLIPWSYRRTG
jgi:hypothetical protein